MLSAHRSTMANDEPDPRFRIEAPTLILEGVPLPADQVVTITALTADDEIDTNFQGPVEITGIKIFVNGEQATLPEWKAGVLTLQSHLDRGQYVFIEDSIVTITAGEDSASHEFLRVWKWLALLPPVLAIGLAIWWKQVIPALLAAVFAGAIVMAGGDPATAFLRTLDTYILHQLAPPDGSTYSMRTILFTLWLGGMIGIMSASGGTRALVDRLTTYARSREHGQIMTWLLGMVVFFDDYANTLMVGSTMRSAADRLRISREKLAFLVDSTAAPIAGLAIVSTWVGYEVGQIKPALEHVGSEADAYTVFLATIPYRFYPILLIGFVGMIAWSGRDFGPMKRFEDGVSRDPNTSDEPAVEVGQSTNLWNAVLPISVLLVTLAGGMYWELNYEPEPDSYQVLLYSSFAAMFIAAASALVSKSLTLAETVDAGIDGLKSMLLACVILTLAWSIGTLCNEGHLNTAGLIIHQLGGELSPRWMPAIAFVVSAAVSFATGSSFATMGLLMPLFITLTYTLFAGSVAVEAFGEHPFLLGTVGAVLAGSIWGDHCSPISDTTVLSSAAAGCDHLSHVSTQMPYAMTVGVVSLVCCALPLGWGVSPYATLPVAFLVLLGIVFGVGRKPTEVTETAE